MLVTLESATAYEDDSSSYSPNCFGLRRSIGWSPHYGELNTVDQVTDVRLVIVLIGLFPGKILPARIERSLPRRRGTGLR